MMGRGINRRSPRKENYDYSLPGHYFVTIVVKDRRHALASITEGNLTLSGAGQIVKDCWSESTEDHGILSEAFVVMPNHVHGIVQLATDLSSINGKEASLGQFIRKFKGKSTYMVHKNESASFQWQRNFYDHIIRNDRELTLLRLYIATNPILWNYDPENSSRQ